MRLVVFSVFLASGHPVSCPERVGGRSGVPRPARDGSCACGGARGVPGLIGWSHSVAAV